MWLDWVGFDAFSWFGVTFDSGGGEVSHIYFVGALMFKGTFTHWIVFE